MSQLHDDRWTTVDLLQRKGLLDLLFVQVSEPEHLPLVFGVHGDWGAGKTSFLKQLQEKLEKQAPNVVTVWFEAWRYQHETAPIIALLQEIRQQLSNHRKLMESVATIGAGVLDGLLTNFGTILKAVSVGAIELDYKGIGECMGARATARGEDALTTDRVRALLEEAIGKVIQQITKGEAKSRLVIFIDDLDRCEPDAVYQTLQSIKVYLGLNNCVFVLGINQHAIIEALARQYGAKNLEDIRHYAGKAGSYIEKIYGNVYSLPPPSEVEKTFVDHWIKALPEVVLGEAIEAALQEQGAWVGCLPPNPRRLKMLANSLARAWGRLRISAEWTAAQTNDAEKTRLLRALVCVTYCFQFHHALFLNWRGAVEAGLGALDRWLARAPELRPDSRRKFEQDYCLHHPIAHGGLTSDEPVPHLPDRADPGFFWIAPLYELLRTPLATTAPSAPAPTPAATPASTPSSALGASPDQALPIPSAMPASPAPATLNPRVAAFEVAFRHVY